MKACPRCLRQRGAAVISALLIVALAVTLVTGLLWQQHVQIRALENQRLSSQAQWLQRAALDWARLILRDDLRRSSTDHLGEVWAVPLAETRLADFLGQSAGTPLNSEEAAQLGDTVLSGQIVDAQGRFNLSNLLQSSANGERDSGSNLTVSSIDPAGVASYARLLTLLGGNPQLAQRTADYMWATWQSPQAEPNGQNTAPAMPLQSVEDLARIPGYDAALLQALQAVAVILPRRTLLNANTARAEVLAASVAGLDVAVAQQLVQRRQQTHFNNVGDAQNVLSALAPNLALGTLSVVWDVKSNYFLVYGAIRHGHAERLQAALIGRYNPSGQNATDIVWVKAVDQLPKLGD